MPECSSVIPRPREKTEFLMPDSTTQQLAPSATTFPVRVDLKALQKAMVVTRIAYNGVLTGMAAMPSVPIRKPKATAKTAELSPTHHQDAFGDTDEKHLPWSFD
jgi:hypothetical protein